MFELFVIGTFWFWFLIVVEIVLLFVFVNTDNTIGAGLSLVVFLLGLQFFGGNDIFGYIATHPGFLVLMVLGYLAAGVVWAVIRWYLFCVDQVRHYNDLKARFLEEKGQPQATEIPQELQEEWLVRLQGHSAPGDYSRKLSDIPKVRDHKRRIINWMAFWVISMIWFFINDLVRRVFREIYYFISDFLQNIANKVFAGVENDLKDTGSSRTHRDGG